MIDIESTRLEIIKRLPFHVGLLVRGEHWFFDFSRSLTSLRPITGTDLNGWDVEDEWAGLYLFGETDYAEGGGSSSFLGVHRDTGEILGLDVEREVSQLFLLNSNIDRFIRTLLKIEEILRVKPTAAGRLSTALKEIDSEAFAHSEWKAFSDYIE